MKQSEALDILKTGASVFLTGEPGSGKTHTVNRYITWLRERGIEPAITASTGIAATHVGGMTIHSWSGVGVRQELSKYDLDTITQNKQVVDRISKAKVLIIDEVSMLSADMVSMADTVCREIRRNDAPFGGLQVVFVGDFFQLPPVSRSRSAAFAYASPAWKKLSPVVCYLSEQHRQEDEVFLSLLSAVRAGSFSESHKDLLRKCYSPEPRGRTTQLYSHNADVDAINSIELKKLAGEEREFVMKSNGSRTRVESLKRGCLSPEVLRLKIGARVLFTKNDTITRKYVNGTLGTVTGFSTENNAPVVRTTAGKTVIADPVEWSLTDDGKVLARIIQVPLRLAWAITVHKSQGMSLDAAHMDLSKTFEYGQGYVALSRVRTLSGLTLAGLNERAVEVHPEISEKDAEFRERSDEAREAFGAIARSELEVMQRNFMQACGGREPRPGEVVQQPTAPVKKPREEKWVKTLACIQKGMSFEEVVAACEKTPSTIAKHICELLALNKLTEENVEALTRNIQEDIEYAHEVFEKIGAEKLKPVYERLGGSVTYETLHVARALFENGAKE